jgi:hypothetical protein
MWEINPKDISGLTGPQIDGLIGEGVIVRYGDGSLQISEEIVLSLDGDKIKNISDAGLNFLALWSGARASSVHNQKDRQPGEAQSRDDACNTLEDPYYKRMQLIYQKSMFETLER